MMFIQRQLGEIILSDPDVQGLASQTGNNDNPTTANTGKFSIVLKPRDERKSSASQVVDRLRAAVAEKVTGANLFMQVAQDINVGVRLSRGGFEYTLQSVDVAELIEWSQKLLDKLQMLPQLTNVSSDLLAKAPQLNVKINRDHASRFGISAQMIDDTLYDAYGQRQIAVLHSAQHQPAHPRDYARAAGRSVFARSPLRQVAGHRGCRAFARSWTSIRTRPVRSPSTTRDSFRR
jgi:multidrug efflux pump subunit AcrB